MRPKHNYAASNKSAKQIKLSDTVMTDEDLKILQFAKYRQRLKRLNESDLDAIITLGSPVHNCLKPNMCGPIIKRRFIDPP